MARRCACAPYSTAAFTSIYSTSLVAYSRVSPIWSWRREARVSATASAASALGIVIVLAPGVTGVATRTTAALTHRRGAPVFQLYLDLFKLWRRGAVFSDTTTWVF